MSHWDRKNPFKKGGPDWRNSADVVLPVRGGYANIAGADDNQALLDDMFKHEADPGKHKASSEIVLILDRSSSMGRLRDSLIEGVNTFIADQKKEGEEDCLVSMIQFDDRYGDPSWYRRPLADFEDLTPTSYAPRGSTALLDAMGKTLNQFITWKDDGTVTGKVLFVVHTDGEENSSVEFKKVQDIIEMITKVKEDFKWDVIFLGSSPDAWDEGAAFAGTIGFANTVSTHANAKGLTGGYAYASTVSRAFRSGKTLDEGLMKNMSDTLAADGDIEEMIAQADADLKAQD